MRTVLCILFLGTFVSAAPAQEGPVADISVEELVERLSPQKGVKLRSLRGLTVSPRDEERPRVDLAVEFEYDSAQLTQEAQGILSVVAEAFKADTLRHSSFRLAGHTDARGGAAYNQELSEARARSVRAFLSERRGIESWRLETEGYGETRLLFPDNPDDGRNRRVEITTLN